MKTTCQNRKRSAHSAIRRVRQAHRKQAQGLRFAPAIRNPHSEFRNRLTVADIGVRLPCFFPSISSVKANLLPVDYLEFLVAAEHPVLLISAYDVAKAATD